MLTYVGLLLVGDYSLATGTDLHVKHVGRVLAASDVALAWVSMIPADRVAIAAAIDRAWQHPDWVLSFGGLGAASDDHVRATVAALQCGREDVGLPRWRSRTGDGFMECGNVVFFAGHPDRAHPAFRAWFTETQANKGTPSAANEREIISWTLPETAQAVAARAQVKRDFPAVMQRILPAGDGRVKLCLTGMSKGRTQAARKSLQRALQAPGGFVLSK